MSHTGHIGELKYCHRQGIHTCRLGSIHVNERDEEAIKLALTTSFEKGKEEGTELERDRAILVMNEFVTEKGEDYSLGQYLNMLLALKNKQS